MGLRDASASKNHPLFGHSRFCEVEVKWKVYKEHRENCFTENLDKIKGFKEAPLPKECPKDENHILYQWPDRKSEKHSILLISAFHGPLVEWLYLSLFGRSSVPLW